MNALHMRRIDAGRNMKRFYKLDVQPDLFGGFTLISEWGRIGHAGQVRTRTFSTSGEAFSAQQRKWCEKAKRGYALLQFSV